LGRLDRIINSQLELGRSFQGHHVVGSMPSPTPWQEVLMRIEELLVDPRRREHAAMPEADALTQSDALREAQLLDVRFDALRSSVWLLFDCRGGIAD
jgi:hypothetical protein